MTPQEKQAFRIAFARDKSHGWRVMRHEHSAMVAEYRLSNEGIQPEMLRALERIGGRVRNA